ncbi:MAG TPA: beta-galactosidase [Thermoanaerobaculia bacterium]|nr:beta-galactosidase [Thermoanaerobaculia bacterium]
MQHRLKLFSPLLLSLVLLAGTARGASADTASPYGVNVHVPQGQEMNAAFDRLKAAGIGWVRIDFIWAWAEPARGKYDWRLYDAIAAAASARGLQVYATVAYTPAWATDGSEITGVPRNPDDWRRFCFRAAKRYRRTIQYWGLWNEANLPRFWSGSRQQYIDVILKTGADAIHSGNPTAKVGGPDLAHLTAGDADWYDWLRHSLLEAGDRLDFITHHLYDSDGNRDVTDKLEDKTTFGGRPSLWDAVLPSVKEVLRSTGWLGKKPFWLTETGWESARVSEDRQAAYYGGLLDDWLTGRSGRDWVEKIFFYELKDGPPETGLSWGLWRPDGSPKPAWEAYRGFIADHAGD